MIADMLNNYSLQQRIEKKLGYTLKDLRKDITTKPINLLRMDKQAGGSRRIVLKNASLKELSYFFFRKIWFVISGHDHREKRRRKKQQTEGIV